MSSQVSLQFLVSHIIKNDYKPCIKYGNQKIDIKKERRSWKTYKSSSQKHLMNDLLSCKSTFPMCDILLEAYDKETEILEVYQVFDYQNNLIY